MIDLDQALLKWVDARPWDHPLPAWTPESAKSVGDRVAREHDLRLDWEPPDEEWVNVWRSGVAAMISTLFPLALTTHHLRSALTQADEHLVVIEVSSFGSEELRASPDVLRATLLRLGWADDFDTNGFCASDLFVESV